LLAVNFRKNSENSESNGVWASKFGAKLDVQ
jgi:hypothetical protein